MLLGGFLSISPVIRAGGGIHPLFGQFVVLKVKSENRGATMTPGTGSRHLVPKESMLGSASWPTRPMPAFGPALVFPGQVGRGRGRWCYFRCYHRFVVTKRSVSL